MPAPPPAEFKAEVPIDITNEQILVAAALVDAKACAELVALVPRADYFVDDQAAAIWQAVLELSRRKLAVDVPAVQRLVAGKAKPDYVRQLAAAFPKPPANLRHHVEALRWDAVRAQAVRGPVSALLDALRDPAAPPDRVRALGKSVAQALDVKGGSQFMRDPAALAREIRDELLEMRKQSSYPSGISGLDGDPDTGARPRLTPGIAPGFVTTVTGVSGNGKSALAMIVALAQARLGRRVLYGAWEMGDRTTMRILALMSLAADEPGAGWTTSALRDGMLDDEHVEYLRQRVEQLGAYIKFFDPPFQSETNRRYRNNDAIDVVANQIADSGCEVYVLDLWERMIPDAKPEDERRALFRQQQVTQQTRTHGVLVAQQKSKEIEASEDKRPTRGGILGSGAWVEVSDHIIGAFRPALYKAIADDLMEVLVLKQRHGRWPFTVECDWDVETYQLKNGREVVTRAAERDEATAGIAAKGFLGEQRRRRR